MLSLIPYFPSLANMGYIGFAIHSSGHCVLAQEYVHFHRYCFVPIVVCEGL